MASLFGLEREEKVYSLVTEIYEATRKGGYLLAATYQRQLISVYRNRFSVLWSFIGLLAGFFIVMGVHDWAVALAPLSPLLETLYIGVRIFLCVSLMVLLFRAWAQVMFWRQFVPNQAKTLHELLMQAHLDQSVDAELRQLLVVLAGRQHAGFFLTELQYKQAVLEDKI